MSVKPRTIDNLGVETSSRYARDQARLDKTLLEEARLIPQKAEVSVLKPYLPTDFEHYLLPNKQVLWAAFEPPPEYLVHSKSLFSYQMIPSLGEYEEEDLDKVEALEDAIHKDFQNSRDHQEEREEEKERQTILTLLKTIERLDRSLSLINSRRNQYQRG